MASYHKVRKNKEKRSEVKTIKTKSSLNGNWKYISLAEDPV